MVYSHVRAVHDSCPAVREAWHGACTLDATKEGHMNAQTFAAQTFALIAERLHISAACNTRKSTVRRALRSVLMGASWQT
jgi:hypothetical protein